MDDGGDSGWIEAAVVNLCLEKNVLMKRDQERKRESREIPPLCRWRCMSEYVCDFPLLSGVCSLVSREREMAVMV